MQMIYENSINPIQSTITIGIFILNTELKIPKLENKIERIEFVNRLPSNPPKITASITIGKKLNVICVIN